MKANNENMIRVFHLTQLTREERDRLNASDAGWSSEPRFSRYADITTGFSKRLADQVAEAWKLGEYHEAADVATDSLDWAYERTNSISQVWGLNDDVEALTDVFKSTSVGDIMLKDGKYFVVAPVGFEPIDLIDIDLTESDEHHFFAVCIFGWAMAETRDAAIKKLVSRFRVDFKKLVASDRKSGLGAAYVWTCRVNQSSYDYGTENYAPHGVDWTASQEHTITRATLKSIEYVTKGDAA